jgi:hypothetical protein
MSQTIKYLTWWIILTGLYLLFAWTIAWAEVGVGLLASAITTWLIAKVQSQGKYHFKAGAGWLVLFKRLPVQVVTDTGLVLAALWRRLAQRDYHPGAFQTLPFHTGGDTPEAAARRALVTAGASFSPNSYVVLIELENDSLLIHQLVPSVSPSGRGDQEWPL